MKLLIACDAIFSKEENDWYCNVIDYNLIMQFKDFFESIEVVGRRGAAKKDFVKIDIENVIVNTVDAVTRPKGLIKITKIKKQIEKYVFDCNAVYCRGFNGIMAQRIARVNHVPHVTFVGGCVHDSMMNIGSSIYKLLAPLVAKLHKKSIKDSDNVMYCAPYLAKRYPTNGRTFFWTEVKLPTYEEAIFRDRIERIKEKNKLTVGLVGQIMNNIKGISTAIDAMAELDEKYILKILGPGDKEKWEKYAKEKGVYDRVIFCGVVEGGEEVIKWMDEIDIYIQPSLTEGLPKATLEAMSRGCPVITSGAGGLSDITEDKFIHPAKDYKRLAELIEKLGDDKEEMIRSSKYSIKVSKKFNKDNLDRIFGEVCEKLIAGGK